MKKLTAIIISILLFVSVFSVTCFADEITGWSSSITVDGKNVSFINNDFYKNHYDTLFEKYYEGYCYCRNAKNPENYIIAPGEKIEEALHNRMFNSDDTFYLSVYMNYQGDVSAENNNSILKNTQGIKSVLYVGNTTPCAVISVDGGNDIEEILKNEKIDCVTLCFSDFTKVGAFTTDIGDIIFTPTAADARAVLRYSAGLGAPEKEWLEEYKKFYYLSDTDLNGIINAKDARTVLRIAAKLEEGKYYEVNGSNTGDFWRN